MASLVLSDGTVFRGKPFGHSKDSVGEIVFQTGMVGYIESMTDPSYLGQILVLTYPLIGNYGVPSEEKDHFGLMKNFESNRIWVSGLVVSSCPDPGTESHYSSVQSLSNWMSSKGVVGIQGIDTRALTKYIREKGTMTGRILIDSEHPNIFSGLEYENDDMTIISKIKTHLNPTLFVAPKILVSDVCSKTPVLLGNPDHPKIIAVDTGIKNNQLRYLLQQNLYIKLVPFDYDFVHELTTSKYSGLYLSNGPGNPQDCTKLIENVKKVIDAKMNIPIFGICLGNQIIGLSAGFGIKKMKYGNRGHNHPCMDTIVKKCFITSQNHGYMVDLCNNDHKNNTSWHTLFFNLNDQSNEGIYHSELPYFSVQFHPEHAAGPQGTECLFQVFRKLIESKHTNSLYKGQFINLFKETISDTNKLTMKDYRPYLTLKRVLILGSGGLCIGQAGEFDYSGSQAIKALKEEGIYTILINPNIATVQTTRGMADSIYMVPVNYESVEKVIELEKPDGILLAFGGQTALNCGLELSKRGILSKHNVQVLGTSIDTINMTEDRKIFSEKMKEIGESVAPSMHAFSIEEALSAAENLGYPVMVRSAFSLGGRGSGFADNSDQLIPLVQMALGNSPQIIIDKSLTGWKEIEYEVIRDSADNCITICNMENLDPLGIHTGESIVVAPSQTLTDNEYNILRAVAIKVVRFLGVIGECNIQYALDPHSMRYYIIEVNARLSRSSALASKATGYPLAYIGAKLSIGLKLYELPNACTSKGLRNPNLSKLHLFESSSSDSSDSYQKIIDNSEVIDNTPTLDSNKVFVSACFEPSLDYLVVKMPRWDMNKFVNISTRIGTSMKSVGEVMAIGRCFEEAIQKAIRMVDIGADGFESCGYKYSEEELRNPSDKRIFYIAAAFEEGKSVEHIYNLTKIDKWFLYALQKIITISNTINKDNSLTINQMKISDILKLKQMGFSDIQLGKIFHCTSNSIREYRHMYDILPKIRQIDTVSGEYPAITSYLYLTYNAVDHDKAFVSHKRHLSFSSDEETLEQQESSSSSLMKSPKSKKNTSFSLADSDVNTKIDTISSNKPKIIVLGSGVYRIGSSVEFDCCSVLCVKQLNLLGYQTIMVNFNPETVSTDYDECDRLYFDEISLENVFEIYRIENPKGVIISMGGQLPNNIAMDLHRLNVNILGTSADMIDQAENRFKFSRLIDSLNIKQPIWKELTTHTEAINFAKKVGYPVLIRPSYVLSGAAMNVAFNRSELVNYLTKASLVSKDHPVVISKFILDAKEIDVDAVSFNGKLLCVAISEHVENAGTHSGDASLILPPQNINNETMKQIQHITREISKSLNVSGPFNLQLIAKNNELKVIECNLRVSRSFPFVSKVLNLDFVALATTVIVNGRAPVIKVDQDFKIVSMSKNTENLLPNSDYLNKKSKIVVQDPNIIYNQDKLNFLGNITVTENLLNILLSKEWQQNGNIFNCNPLEKSLPFTTKNIAVKVPQFSFGQLGDADVRLGVEMASTGEVAAFGETHFDAFLKALVSSGFKIPKYKNVFLSIGPFKAKMDLLESIKTLSKLGFKLYGSSGTSDFYTENGVETINFNNLYEDFDTDKLFDDKNEKSEQPSPVLSRISEIDVPSITTSGRQFDIKNFLLNFNIDLIINIPVNFLAKNNFKVSSVGYHMRRFAADYSIPLITERNGAKLLINALDRYYNRPLPLSLSVKPTVDNLISGNIIRLPGFIDCHVHMREPGAEYKEDYISGTTAALRGGITCVLCMPNTNPAVTNVESFSIVKQLASSKSLCDFGLYIGATDSNYDKIGLDLIQKSSGMKMYLNDTFTTLKLTDFGSWVEHFKNWPKDSPVPILVHAEQQCLASILYLVNVYKVRVHVCHVSTKNEIEMIRKAKEDGLPITCEVTPHHLFLARKDFTQETIKRVGVKPPLNSTEDQKALWKNIDVIDCFATDHAPHIADEKDGLNGFTSPPGYPGIETMVPLLLTAVMDGKLTINDVVDRLYTNPMRIFNIPVRSDTFIDVELGPRSIISASKLSSKSGWTPFEGRVVTARVARVIVRGELAMTADRVYVKPGFGKDICEMRSLSNTTKLESEDILPALTTSGRSRVRHLSAGNTQIRPTDALVEVSDDKKFSVKIDNDIIYTHNKSNNIELNNNINSEILNINKNSFINNQNISSFYSQIFSSEFICFFKERSFYTVNGLNRDHLRLLFNIASKFKLISELGNGIVPQVLAGKVIALSFFEPSTRTMNSFQSAVQRLGGSCFVLRPSDSSMSKGETLEDTCKVLSSLSHGIVMRHPVVGTVKRISKVIEPKPVVNAGDGIGEHPTQALLDTFTIREEIGTVNGLTVCFVGDLKHGRTVHSLSKLLTLYNNMRFFYVAPDELQMPDEIIEYIKSRSEIEQIKTNSLDKVISKCDVLYMTRIQKERFSSVEEYSKYKGCFNLTKELMSKAKPKMIVLHPLPRVDEISTDVDTDIRAAYFRQVEYGVYLRMALMSCIFGNNSVKNNL